MVEDRVVGHGHVHLAFLAEARVDLSGVGVESDQPAAGGEDDTRRIGAVTRPIRDTPPGGRAASDRVAPEFLAGFGFERHNAVRGRKIHHAVHHNRRGFRVGAAAPSAPARGSRGSIALQLIGPYRCQLRDVRGVDLLERRIVRAGQIVRVDRPVGSGVSIGLSAEQRRYEGRRKEEGAADAHGSPP